MIDKNTQEKIEFSGIIRSVQPRSNVWRYRLDNRTHSMTGYNLFLSGTAEGEEGNFAVAISEKQMLKHRFHIGDAACWTAVPGRESASANGPAWQMWRSNTTGVSPRSSVLRASATVRKTANSIRWENPGLFLTKTADQFTMKDGSMRFAQKTAMMKSEECTLPQRMQSETALKNYVLEAIVESIQSDSFSDVYSKLLDNYKGFSTTGKTYRTPSGI